MKRLLCLLILAAPLGCNVEDGTMIEILLAQLPDKTACTYSSESLFARLVGFYDPTGRDSYELGLLLRNHLDAKSTNETELGEGVNIRPAANSAQVMGFDVCFFREDDPTLDVNEVNDKAQRLVDCGKLPKNQQRFIAASGFVDAESNGVTAVDVLSHPDLGVLYGAFDPFDLPYKGIFARDIDNDGVITAADGIYYSHGPEYPTENRGEGCVGPSGCETLEEGACMAPCRWQEQDPWGDFPSDRKSDRVVVQLRGLVKLQSGRQIHTNWFSYPIEVCPGCVLRSCGAMEQVQCPLACDGSGCGNPTHQVNDQPDPLCRINGYGEDCLGRCLDADDQETARQCEPYGFSGSVPDIVGCMTFQGVNPPDCIATNTCNQW